MGKHQGRVGVHRIQDLALGPEEKALFLSGFYWALHKARVNPQRFRGSELSRIGGRSEVASLRALGNTPSSRWMEVLTFPPLSPRESNGQGGRREGQDHWGAAGRRVGLWGMGLEGELRNTNVVTENCPLPQKSRKLGQKLPVHMEGQEEGVKFRW